MRYIIGKYTSLLLAAAVTATAPAARTLDAQSPAAVASVTGQLVVRPGDVLRIKIWPDVALGGEFPIEETGMIYLPILGAVQAGGRSIEALRTELRSRYAESMKSPVVTVTPLVRVSVIGAVARPGIYFVPPTESLVDVVLQAGGFNDQADENGMRLVRDGKSTRIEALESVQAGQAGSLLALRSDDWIIVPKRKGFSIGVLFSVLQVATLAAVLLNRSAK